MHIQEEGGYSSTVDFTPPPHPRALLKKGERKKYLALKIEGFVRLFIDMLYLVFLFLFDLLLGTVSLHVWTKLQGGPTKSITSPLKLSYVPMWVNKAMNINLSITVSLNICITICKTFALWYPTWHMCSYLLMGKIKNWLTSLVKLSFGHFMSNLSHFNGNGKINNDTVFGFLLCKVDILLVLSKNGSKDHSFSRVRTTGWPKSLGGQKVAQVGGGSLFWTTGGVSYSKL